AGLGAALTAVTVGKRTPTKSRVQPPAMVPLALPSSLTYRLHGPLGLTPGKSSTTVPEGAGAGAGKKSGWPSFIFVGRNVPETRGPSSGSPSAAAASRVSVRLLTGLSPPTSDRRMMLAPLGATNRMSKTSGASWLMLWSVTVTFPAVPGSPETSMVEGYGAAG